MSENKEGLAVAWEWVEKAESDLRVAQGTGFRKIHDLGELMLLIPSGLRPSLDEREQARLTEYATVTRYPGDYEPITLSEAREAIKIARRIRGEVRKLLQQKPPFSKESP
jgi:HEPN domain-containing protein